VRTKATIGDDGLKEATVQLFKPIGSTFRFLSQEPDEAVGPEMAPPALAYLAAGVGFCYMTQMGRYAHIVKQDLESYRIIQDNIFNLSGQVSNGSLTASAEPVNTQVFVDMAESDEAAQTLVRMSERTCFLHAAMRSATPSQIDKSPV
jgi:OsmC-like protein